MPCGRSASDWGVAAVSAVFDLPPWLDRTVRSNLRMMAMRKDEPPPPKRAPALTSDPTAVDASAELVSKARTGDRAAFRSLFDRHRADVARLVYRMVGPRADLEDLVQ